MARKRNHKETARPDRKPSGSATPRAVNDESFINRYRQEILICLVLALVIDAIYWQVGSHKFINLDDDVYVYNNPAVLAGLTAEGFKWALTAFQSANWHPLTWLSHMLDVQLFGLNAGRHLYTNLAFHILNTLLLFLALRRMTGAIWRSALVAALFAVHPLHVESVAWVSERKDVLSTFFWLLTLWAYARYTEQTASWGRYLLVILSLALGLMAKPMLVTLPFVLLLLDYWPLNRLRWEPAEGFKALWVKALVREKLPLFALVVASSVVTYFAQQYGGAVKSLTRFPLSLRLSNVAVSYVSYIGKMLWPGKLAVYYPYERTLHPVKAIGAALLLLSITALVIYAARRRGYLLTGWLWYLGTLVPVIGFVQVGEQALADRYTYVPLIGLFIIIVWGVADALEKSRWRQGATAFAAGILVVLSVLAWQQVGRWQDSVTLYEHTLSVTANNYVIQTNLGHVLSSDELYVNAGRRPEGIEHLREALRIEPYFFEAHNSLGAALQGEQKFDEALKHFEVASRLQPDVAKVHSNLGAAYGALGKLDEAAAQLYEAQRLDPDYADAYLNLGIVLLGQGKNEEAVKQLAAAVRLQPDNAESHNAYGIALREAGQLAEAIKQFKIALTLNPNHPKAQINLRNAQGRLNQQ